MTPEPDADRGRFAYEGLERVMHEKARLSILTSLATNPRGLFFTDLKKLCELTDGNLSRHLKALAESELVETIRGTDGQRPQTLVRMTAGGRKRFREYVAELERVVSDAMETEDGAEGRSRPWPEGWSPA